MFGNTYLEVLLRGCFGIQKGSAGQLIDLVFDRLRALHWHKQNEIVYRIGIQWLIKVSLDLNILASLEVMCFELISYHVYA